MINEVEMNCKALQNNNRNLQNATEVAAIIIHVRNIEKMPTHDQI